MKLHEAIENLLKETGRPMTTNEIADSLNNNKWYQKKDKSLIDAFQIHGRTRKYSNLFSRKGSTISLPAQIVQSGTIAPIRVSKKITEKTPNVLMKASIPEEIQLLKKSFIPISSVNTKILILGTMPGDESIRLGEYYANPRNRFWKVMSTILNEKTPETYDEKKLLLKNYGIGLWDVLKSAEREGSLDISISKEVPNNLESFLKTHKQVLAIGFNGKKAEVLYDKFFSRRSNIKYYSLPSTSPANAGINFETICEQWEQAIN